MSYLPELWGWTQLELIDVEATRRREARQKYRRECMESYSVEYCLKQIRDEHYLWDMRTWHKHKDLAEVWEWVNAFFSKKGAAPKNCGHTAFCVDLLLNAHQVEPDKVVKAIMANKFIEYEDEKFSWDHTVTVGVFGPQPSHFAEEEELCGAAR